MLRGLGPAGNPAAGAGWRPLILRRPRRPGWSLRASHAPVLGLARTVRLVAVLDWRGALPMRRGSARLSRRVSAFPLGTSAADGRIWCRVRYFSGL